MLCNYLIFLEFLVSLSVFYVFVGDFEGKKKETEKLQIDVKKEKRFWFIVSKNKMIVIAVVVVVVNVDVVVIIIILRDYRGRKLFILKPKIKK